MMNLVQELCRKLRPVIGRKIDRLWSVYLAESDMAGKADIEQTLELLAAKHLGHHTRVPSLELSTDPPRRSGNCDSGVFAGSSKGTVSESAEPSWTSMGSFSNTFSGLSESFSLADSYTLATKFSET